MLLAIGMKIAGEHKTPGFAQLFQPLGVRGTELALQLPAQLLGERGALPGRRYCDLQSTAADECWVEEITVRGIVDYIAQNAAPAGLNIDRIIESFGAGSDDNEENATEIGRDECTEREPNFPAFCQLANGLVCLESDDVDLGASIEKAANFWLADVSGADNEASPAFELHEHGKEISHRRHLQRE